MNVAIVGRGFAGLGLAFHLLKLDPNIQITFFDQEELFQSASANSTGLFHCFVGKSSKKNPYADEAFYEGLELIQNMEKFGKTCLAKKTGLLKMAPTELQQQEFKQSSEKNNLPFLEKEAVLKMNPDLKALEALYINQGFTVRPREYLKVLWSYCQSKKAQCIFQTIQNVNQLEEFDVAILACGASKLLDSFSFSTKKVKGQMLVCKDEKSTFSKMAITCKGHITFYEKMCFLGSTYERSFVNSKPDISKALEMKEEIAAFYPSAKNLEVLECRAGVRLSRKEGPLPIVGHLNKNVWVFAGLGSRGLLYHSFFAKLLAHAILKDSKTINSFRCLSE